jgi:urease accessory protein
MGSEGISAERLRNDLRPRDRSDIRRPGHGTLRVATIDARSAVVHAFASSPLRLLTPRNHGRAAWIYTSSYGGGLVGGDRLRLDIDIEPGAAAFVSTQASTKVYRSPLGAGAELTARIGADGLLVLVPDPVVCFAESRYEQSQQFDLADQATLIAVDWMTSGRRAFGERWAFREYAARQRVYVGGQLVVYDNLVLRGDAGDLAARMGRFDVLAVALIVGRSVHVHARTIEARVAAQPIGRRSDRLVSAAIVGPGTRGGAGCLVRVAARSVEEAAQTIRECLAFVPELLGDDPWLRKW